MADENYIPKKQKRDTLADINEKFENARKKYRGARTAEERERYYADVMGAEAMRNKINKLRTD